MKKIISFLMMAIFFTAIVQAGESPYKEGELIIQLEKTATIETWTGKYSSISLKAQRLLSRRLNIWLMEFDPKAVSSESALNMVRYDEAVIAVQFNHYVTLRSILPNDPRFSEQWGLHNTGQSGGTPDADIDAPEAWDLTTGGATAQGDEIVIAVIDGGADLNHQDLNFWKNIHEIPGNGIDDDNNGYIDDYDGWNAYNHTGNIPSSSHGTHVSGIAGAKGNNGLGVSGVNWNVKIMPIAGSSGTESIVVEAYGYALELRARYNETNGEYGAFVVVTNSSFGVDYGNPANFPIWCSMYDAMGAEGILSCAATINAHVNVDIVGDVPTGCPSDYLISVTNTTRTDQKNSNAGYGEISIDLGAPGTSILSTLPNNQYGNSSGTSMASPHVAGVVALMFAHANSQLIQEYKNDPAAVALLFKQWLLAGVDPIPALQGITVTGGRLNAHGALQSIGSGVEFQFVNRIQGTTNYGSLVVDNDLNNPVPSGGVRSFAYGTYHQVRTAQLPFLPNWQGGGTTQKHHRWYQNNSDFSLNHQFQAAAPTPSLQDAWFNSTEPATVRTDLISGGQGGIVELKDPWRYYQDGFGNWQQSNQFISYPSPFIIENGQITDYGGVFLNQGLPNWQPPYYTLRVPQTQYLTFHNQVIPWHFVNWQEDASQAEVQYLIQNTSPVVFKQANAEIRARYKGHLASSNPAATRHNNGRRIVREAGGTLHAVYSDGGHCWYTFSTDNGEHWAAESLASEDLPIYHDPAFQYLYPAIAEYEGALHLAYTKADYDEEGNLTGAAVYYRSKPGGEPWGMAKLIFSYSLSDPLHLPQPAIGVWKDGYEYVVIAANKKTASGSEIASFYKKVSDPDFQTIAAFPGSRPSLGTDEWHLNLRVSYDDAGRILLRKWNGSTKTWYGAEQVSEEPWWLGAQLNSNLTHSSDNYSHVVWASQDETLMPVVAYRAHRAPGSGTVTYFYSGPWRGAVYPTVAADYGTPISIFYEDEGRIIKRRFEGEYWLEEGFSEGRYPNAAAHGQSGAIWVRDDNAPYRIVPDYTDPWKMRAGSEDTLLINKRFDYTFTQDTSAGYLTLEIQNLACGGGYLQLDSLLRSRPITIPANASPQYQLLIHFHNLNFPVDSSAVLVEAAFEAGPNLHSLGKLRLKQLLPFNNGQAHLLAQTLAAGHLRGKTGRLKFSFENLSPLISNVVVRRPERGVPPLAKPGADSSSTLPTRFELSQNYPNPFNPTTTITLSLPQESKVSLEVYDITGRKVRTLLKEALPAGVHKISWDGRNENGEAVGSGVYIYRVVAGAFKESRKMALLR